MQFKYQEYTPLDISVYEHLISCASSFEEHTAISYYGIKFSFKKLFEKIDETARALTALGVKKDDVIAASLPGIPEGIFLIYAINKIGAKYCAFDCRSKSQEIKETLRTFSPKLCFVPDFQVKELSDVYDHTIVHVSPLHSIGGPMKIAEASANLFQGRSFLYAKHSNIISFEAFIKKGKGQADPKVTRSTDNVFGYFYTSGTTYGRKSVILSNENLIATVAQQKWVAFNVEKDDSILNIMPLFTCYSVSLAMHLPLVYGVCVNLVPLVDVKKMKKLILSKKPNYIITVPAHWEFFRRENFDGCDLSFLKVAIIGGDTIDPKYKKKIDSIFSSCGSNAKLTVGYGLTETTSTGTVAFNYPDEKSVGIPVVHTKIGIFNQETLEQLAPYEKGEICISSPSVCQGYYKEPAMTDALLKVHSDGRTWLHSGDIGYIDENGALFFCERIKRMYVRFDGSKISPYSIEQVISTCPIVERVVVVAIPDTDHTHGKCAKAFIVLKEGTDRAAAEKALPAFFKKNLDEHMVPKEFVITDRLQYTKNGKIDYFAQQ